MDTELVAVDRADGNRLKAFQELSTRARGMTEMHQVGLFFSLLPRLALAVISRGFLQLTSALLPLLRRISRQGFP